jgi:hypothetical protein
MIIRINYSPDSSRWGFQLEVNFAGPMHGMPCNT